MAEKLQMLQYRENPDGTVTVIVKGEETGTFENKSKASDAVDASITNAIQKLAEKFGVGDKVAKILGE
ncbi:MAG: hypothetical protein WA152_02780 [Microgenomates group bacterium]